MKLKYPIIPTTTIRNCGGTLTTLIKTEDGDSAVVIWKNSKWILSKETKVSDVISSPEISEEILKTYKRIIKKQRQERHKLRKSKRKIQEEGKLNWIEKKLYSPNYRSNKKIIENRKLIKKHKIHQLNQLRSSKKIDE